jgi:hypothetical protein
MVTPTRIDGSLAAAAAGAGGVPCAAAGITPAARQSMGQLSSRRILQRLIIGG